MIHAVSMTGPYPPCVTGARRHVIAGLAFAVSLLAAQPTMAFDTSIRDLFEKVTRSVVVVRTIERMVIDGQTPMERAISDVGSGVLISDTGLVVTAAHLVQAADLVQVTFADGTRVMADILASEPAADIALLETTNVPESATASPLGDSDVVAVGEQVIVVGAPYGLGHSLSVGYVSARHASPAPGGPVALGELFQTDASINRGNSGGPMFNAQGEVIGIVSYILSRSGAFEGIGFAITSETVRDLLLERTGFWSGVTVFALSATQARALNLPREYGALVQRVAHGSIARELGLRAGFLPSSIGGRDVVLGGDVILTVNDIPVGANEDYERLREYLVDLKPGDEVGFEIFRRGEIVDMVWKVTDEALHHRPPTPEAPAMYGAD